MAGGFEVPQAFGKLARASGTMLMGNADVKNFKSFGSADYNVPDNAPESYQAANAIVVATGKNAKGEVRFYYPTAEQK